MNGSLQHRLSRWIAGITLLSGLVAGCASFFLAFREAQELQDDQLRQVALLVGRSGKAPRDWAGTSGGVDDTDPDARIIVTTPGETAPNPRLPVVPAAVPGGFQTVDSNGTAWRLFVHTLPSGKRIATGQMTAVRNEIARDSGLRTMIPIMLLMPALALLASWVIRRALAPVMALSGQLDRRDDSNLTAIPATDVPTEIQPFVGAINGLMQRLSVALVQQRRFIADAAHELRSPLTALMVQAENLEQSSASAEGRSRIQLLKAGLERAGKLLEQLLNLARCQTASVPACDVRFDDLLRQVVEEHMPLALAKGIDFGCKRFEPVCLRALPEDLTMLARNAVDNALRYTPRGGTVDVSLYQENGQAVFLVEDTGPGIPPDEKERIFEPFYRIMGSGETGSGLGLAIARSIADRLGGSVELGNRTDMRGARFCYRQPNFE